MKGYLKFWFNDFKETFKEGGLFERIMMIAYLIWAPVMFIISNYEMVDSIINGPTWAAILLVYFNIFLWIALFALIAITIWVYNDLKDII